MIIGSGLIASQFKNWKDNKDIIVFASGVSNSKEKNLYEYQREKNLLKTFYSSNKLLVYFSTCHIFDEEQSESLYVKHKLEIENIVRINFKNYFILRLPLVIGQNKNPNSLFNYFYTEIINKRVINIHKNAIRYFLDIENIEPMIKYVYENRDAWNKTVNMIFDDPVPILKVIEFMEDSIGLDARKNIINKGSNYIIPNDTFKKYKSKIFPTLKDEEYSERVFKKHIRLKINN